MEQITTRDKKYAVRYTDNDGMVIATALQWDNTESRFVYWFTIGEYKSMQTADVCARKKMVKFGVQF